MSTEPELVSVQEFLRLAVERMDLTREDARDLARRLAEAAAKRAA